MIRSVLTMDDGPSGITPEILDFLKTHEITPVLFFLGEMLEEHFDYGVQALRQGAIVGNHSYSHPNFSEISYEACIAEIEKQESMLERLHTAAGIPRQAKLFRFPYGADGGEHAPRIQSYLRAHGFCRLDDRDIESALYTEQSLRDRVDVNLTFDVAEWQLHGGEFTMRDVFARIDDFLAKECPQGQDCHHILLVHDHEQSNELVPGYYRQILEYLLAHGVTFTVPRFLEV